VLERIGREEGSQIVVYGLSSSDRTLENTIAATSAGSLTRSRADAKSQAAKEASDTSVKTG
jgi:hypothetical protein